MNAVENLVSLAVLFIFAAIIIAAELRLRTKLEAIDDFIVQLLHNWMKEEQA